MINRLSGFMIFLLFVLCNQAIGQSYASIQSSIDTVTPGDPIDLQLTVFLEDDFQGTLDFSTWNKINNVLYESDTINFTPYADYAIIDGGKTGINENRKLANLGQLELADNTTGKIIRESLKIAIYDVGIFEIPAPKLNLDRGKVMPTEAAKIVVILPPEIRQAMQDSIGVAPIKNIIEEPITIEDFKYVFIVLGILIASFLLFYFLVVKKKQEEIDPIPVQVYVPPHVTALEKLSDLKEKQLWQQGKIKQYQSELTFIIREYLENRFKFRALEMTSGEIIKSVPEEVNKEELQNILQIADLVKFAKASPPEDLHSQFLDKAFTLVNSTKQIETLEDD